ncbi:hypothetical protein F7725_012745 [Dissostichus mawsoni]|uniref:Uncharacterized protein n=1 Tax=Dissostichus mawsoni TaxID=36200 RepID=A0A7J5YPB4_DISMA|nr:hypothetical protein F7725_012745 [Dissostichus mawsoni]
MTWNERRWSCVAMDQRGGMQKGRLRFQILSDPSFPSPSVTSNLFSSPFSLSVIPPFQPSLAMSATVKAIWA